MKGPSGPAAWAVVTATIAGGAGVRAIADAKGRTALLFPYPEPLGGGTNGLIGVRLTEETWPVTLSVRYAPAAGKIAERAVLPGTLTQAAGTLWQKWDANPALRQKLGANPLTLKYANELTLGTTGAAQGCVMYTTQP